MKSLVRAELIKLRTVRMPVWLLLTALGLVTLLVLVTVPAGNAPDNTLSLRDEDLLARTLGVGAGGGWVIMLVLGILSFTQELRFGTATSTFLVTPVRGRVLIAKSLALAVVGLVFAAATIALDVALSVVLIVARGGNLGGSAEAAEVLAAVVLVMALSGPIGVAVGALVRNQIAAVVGALVWLLVAEQLLVALLPVIGRWTPGGATAGLLQLGREATTHGDLLPAWAGGLVLLAYATVIGLLASAVTLRRDLT
ncbi:MAG: ABC transporter permease [Actinomycetota bacterium]|nr:ABC transporter permease [Actinomycetota bacterium]